MAVIVYATDPTGLLQQIKAAAAAGTLSPWSVDSDGDLTLAPTQSLFRAWFRPATSANSITFRILTPQKSTMSRGTYAVYHGRLIEMLLNKFDTRFSRVVSTALPSNGDQVRG